jgi:hypothetical protein
MYLIFYLVALFRLHALQGVAESFLSGWHATVLVAAVMVTAGVGIPLRCYLLSAVGFDYQRLGEKFQQMFPFILALDQLWAVAPFLLMQKIGLGAAFGASAALLYVPFSETNPDPHGLCGNASGRVERLTREEERRWRNKR